MTQPPIVSASTPLLFLHVPKTGGMSLFASMAAVWGENIADLYNVSEGDSEGLRRTITGRSDAVYAGHFSYGLHEWIKGECLYATMLREPLARLESLYFFLRRRWPEFQMRLLGGGAGPGRALLPLPDFHQDFRPWLVAGEESPELFFTSPSLELDNGMVRRFSGHGQDPRPCTGEELRMAKQNLETRFSVVGITERYSETIALMSRVFDLPDFKEQRVNVTSAKQGSAEGLGAGLRARIMAANQLDTELYEWVRNRFEGHLSSARPIQVSGSARQDLQNAPLWKGVGSADLRSAIKRHKGSVTRVQAERKRVLKPASAATHRLARMGYSRNDVTLEFSGTAQRGDKVLPAPEKLVLTSQQAEFLVVQLQKLLAAQKTRFSPDNLSTK